jgi:dUTP pyrophosphatase
MKEIKVKVTKEEATKLPLYMTDGAAGMDVYAEIKEDLVIKPLERVLIPTGLKVEIPYGFEIQVRPRSGLAIKHGITLLNTPGTIDSDFRGEIKVIMINISNEEFKIKPRERIGQLVLNKVYKCVWEETGELEESDRGQGGFGHTGK